MDGWGRPDVVGPDVPADPSWADVGVLCETAEKYARWKCRDFEGLLSTWNDRLHDLDGDPSAHDWRAFRPLRIDREEDWSDWLAHLIETSSGAFVCALFSRVEIERKPYRAPQVEREVALPERRADIAIHWVTSSIHVEVKVGDQNFGKTIETATQLEQRHSAASWTHHVLLPTEDIGALEKALEKSEKPFHVITWDNVAVAIRRGLIDAQESVRWRAFAQAFCGTIEQRLFGCPLAAQATVSFAELAARQRQILIMEKALGHERRR